MNLKIETRKNLFSYLVYTVLYVGAVFFAENGIDYAAAICLIAAALYLYITLVRRTGSLVNLRALFSLSWIGGEGIACLKLSYLSSPWEMGTWLSFYLVYLAFCIGYDGISRMPLRRRDDHGREETGSGRNEKPRRLLFCIMALMICSILCFVVEAVIVGFIPILSSMPHAYSYFHVSGVHYFTISCILIPGLSLLYIKTVQDERGIFTRKEKILLVAGNVTAFAVPIICVSRFQLLFAVGFAAVIYVLLYRKITWKMIVAAVIVMVPLYVILTVFRHHDVAYLNGIFEMKNSSIPIFVTQPYIYIANNYENFNCLVRDLSAHTFGIRMLFPFFALTGLKFVFPQLVSTPNYITKTELTTLTMFYDAYYDFGILGVFFFALLLGIIAGYLQRRQKTNPNPVFSMFYGETAIYLGLSFFTTWFSNPTTWFWYVITFLMYLFVGWKRVKG